MRKSKLLTSVRPIVPKGTLKKSRGLMNDGQPESFTMLEYGSYTPVEVPKEEGQFCISTMSHHACTKVRRGTYLHREKFALGGRSLCKLLLDANLQECAALELSVSNPMPEDIWQSITLKISVILGVQKLQELDFGYPVGTYVLEVCLQSSMPARPELEIFLPVVLMEMALGNLPYNVRPLLVDM
jgi:hypothetical protein